MTCNRTEMKLIDLKQRIWVALNMKFRLYHLINGKVSICMLPLLWETKKKNDWTNIGGHKYDNYYVHEIQSNQYNTIDILISKSNDYRGD